MFAFMDILLKIWEGCWNTLMMMAPYLLLGFFLSGLLSVILPVGLVKQHLARRGKASVIKSALIGVPLPLCSCGVLPVATWIRRHGASKGATGAFLLATPQTGVDGFLVALGILGLGFALYIPVAAFVSGIILGLILNLFPDAEENALEPEATATNSKPFWLRVIRHGYVTVAGDIAVPLGFCGPAIFFRIGRRAHGQTIGGCRRHPAVCVCDRLVAHWRFDAGGRFVTGHGVCIFNGRARHQCRHFYHYQ
jgi:uncharacterized protein